MKKILESVKSLLFINNESIYARNYVENPIKSYFKDIEVAVSNPDYKSPLIIGNNSVSEDRILERLNEIMGTKLTLYPDYMYRCENCGNYYDKSDLLRINSESMITLRIVRFDNIYVILPLKSSVKIPKFWYKLDLPAKSIYIDNETYVILKGFIKKGKKVDPRVLEIVLGKSLTEIMYFTEFREENIIFHTPEFRCPNCGRNVIKIVAERIKLGDLTIGKVKDTLILLNEYGKMILAKELTNSDRVYVLSKNINIEKLKKAGFDVIPLRPPTRIQLLNITKSYRSMSFLEQNRKDLDDNLLFNESKAFFMNSVLGILKNIEKGNISKSYELFYNSYRLYNKLFLNASKRANNYHLSTALDFKKLFYQLFIDGSDLLIPNYQADYPSSFNNFMNLFISLEKIKSKTKGRGVRYQSLIISTDLELPPLKLMRDILNVNEITVIKGFWHGLKYKVKPNIEKLGRYYRSYYSSINSMLSKRDGMDIIRKLNSGGYIIGIEGQEIKITREMVDIMVEIPADYVKGIFDGGEYYLNINLEQCEAESSKIIRKVNYLRKLKNLDYKDYIDVYIGKQNCPSINSAIEDRIKIKTRAMKVFWVEGSDILIRKVNLNQLRRALSALLANEDHRESDTLIIEGCRSVMSIINGELGNEAIKQKATLTIKNILKDFQSTDCPLCGSKMEDLKCNFCGLDIKYVREKLIDVPL